MGTLKRRAAVLAFLMFVAAALLATYPPVRHPAGTIAVSLADPIILTTVLAWDADRLLHGLRGLWDPPFLFPHHGTLAYSEHMLGVAILTAPIQWMFGNAVLTYNVAYIGSLPRWMTGERQAGTEWVEVRLPRPAHVRRLEIVGGGRSVLDYPQRLRIDSIDPAGVSQSLFDDGVVEAYVEAVAPNDLHPSIALDLPRNQTVMLRIQQTGRGAGWWSIYELKIWEQKEVR